MFGTPGERTPRRSTRARNSATPKLASPPARSHSRANTPARESAATSRLLYSASEASTSATGRTRAKEQSRAGVLVRNDVHSVTAWSGLPKEVDSLLASAGASARLRTRLRRSDLYVDAFLSQVEHGYVYLVSARQCFVWPSAQVRCQTLERSDHRSERADRRPASRCPVRPRQPTRPRMSLCRYRRRRSSTTPDASLGSCSSRRRARSASGRASTWHCRDPSASSSCTSTWRRARSCGRWSRSRFVVGRARRADGSARSGFLPFASPKRPLLTAS